MAFQRVPETAEALTKFDANGLTVLMTWYARFVGGYSLSDLVALANNVDTRVGNSFLSLMSQDIQYLRTDVRGLDKIDDLEASDQSNAGPGTVVSSGNPNSVTLAIQRNSGLTGRSSRGRVFWIGLAQVQLDTDENFVTATNVTNIGAAVDLMRTSLELSGWDAVIVSRFTGGVKRAEAVTFAWLNTVVTDARVDSQRGRMP